MRTVWGATITVGCALLIAGGAAAEEPFEEPPMVSKLKITTLSTMLTDLRGVGEWGFAALVEVDGQTLLFDTGARPETVLTNARELGIDLGTVDTVVISHNHWDHTGGLVTLRRALKKDNPSALQRAHVGEGIFLPRELDRGALGKLPPVPPELLVSALEVREGYEALGGSFVIHEKPSELHPGVWVTGPIPRKHPEKNWTQFMRIRQGEELIEDTIPEDQALVVNTTAGLVVLAGCGHAGIVNTMEYARSIGGDRAVHAVLGGFHLLNATDEHLAWTGGKMAEFGVEHFVGAHCTGINAVEQLREVGKHDRKTAVVGTVGSTFTLGEGIQPGLLVR